jgi:hypothetical protein
MVAYPQGETWLPPDEALLAATYDPVLCDAATQVTAGTLYLMRLNIRQGITVSFLRFGMSVSGSGTSTGTFVGLYSAAGKLLSGSADVGGPGNNTFATGFESTKLALTTPQLVAAGTVVYAAMLVNLGTTMPTLYRALSDIQFVALADWNPAAGLRFAVNGTGLTALPASLTMANNTPSGARSWWCGVS